MANELERQVIELIAADRIEIPISSMSGKLKRMKPKLAERIEIDGKYNGERVYARVQTDSEMKARGMRDGIDVFKAQYPTYGKILEGMIAEQRVVKENNLYFGMNSGCRLTSDDYMGIMRNLGFSEGTALGMYKEIIDVSRKISKKRQEERSILLE